MIKKNDLNWTLIETHVSHMKAELEHLLYSMHWAAQEEHNNVV